MSMPKVAIVGRPNVGKSSLLNALARRRVSIVDNVPGVTRDRVGSEVELPPISEGRPPRFCELIDTGGYGIYSGDEELAFLSDDVEHQIERAVAEADLVLFVIDVQDGVVPLDAEVARLLRRHWQDPKRVLLVANKADHVHFESEAASAAAFGFGMPLCVSATTGRGRVELRQAIADRIGEAGEVEPQPPHMRLAIVGKRNAGKSTLVNALAGAERVIASEVPGTTRDSVDVRFELDGRRFTAIDTAGVRKRKSMVDDVEYYSLHRALRAIRSADVVLFLIDASGPVSQVDKKLSREIIEQQKPCVIVINKWDLVKDRLKTDDYLDYLSDALRGLNYCPIAFVSAAENDRVRETVLAACDLHEQAGHRTPTAELNQVVEQILAQRGPSPRLGKQAKVYYATMAAVHPPTIAVFVNRPDLFDAQYRRYLVNQFRDRLPYDEVPIKLVVRPRSRQERGQAAVGEA